MGILDRFAKKQVKEKLDGNKPEVAEGTPAVVKAAKKTKTKAVDALPAAEQKKVATHSTSYRVLVRPLVTEKTARQESANKYTFVIDKAATKAQVKRAVKELYGVVPSAVAVAHLQGRRVRFGKFAGKRSDYKKAIITLPKGSSITIHEGV
jgi:large subunit ribosomal protein L23